jgi:branched-chain amino acid transport system substrate-binding protein
MSKSWALHLSAVAITVASLSLSPSQAGAADKVKIGFLSSMSGPSAVLGKDMNDGAQLAIEHLAARGSGIPLELLIEDDQVDPQVGVQKTQKLIEKDGVDIMAGTIFGNVAQAIMPVVTKSGIPAVMTVGSNPPTLGADCNENYFTVAWTIDDNYQALGTYLNEKNIKTVSILAPNYIAGKLIADGFKRTYKGKVLSEVFTKINQPDYSVELTQVRADKPEAVVVFYPGGMGISFLKQYSAMGLLKQIPLYSSVFIADEMMFPALGDIPLGLVTTSNWSPELDNPANKRFVEAFVKKTGHRPTSMAAMGYDTIMLIDSAVQQTKGNVRGSDANRAAFRDALRAAKFESVRGSFRFNNNNFPVQSYYLNEVAKDSSGKLYNKLLGVALKDKEDAYHNACPMKW